MPDSTPDSATVIALPPRPANPVIEQAKSIVMAELNCTPGEAFDLLRRASQRANLKVSVLAAHLIEQGLGGPGLARKRRRTSRCVDRAESPWLGAFTAVEGGSSAAG